jgi:hypothetical protein
MRRGRHAFRIRKPADRISWVDDSKAFCQFDDWNKIKRIIHVQQRELLTYVHNGSVIVQDAKESQFVTGEQMMHTSNRCTSYPGADLFGWDVMNHHERNVILSCPLPASL